MGDGFDRLSLWRVQTQQPKVVGECGSVSSGRLDYPLAWWTRHGINQILPRALPLSSKRIPMNEKIIICSHVSVCAHILLQHAQPFRLRERKRQAQRGNRLTCSLIRTSSNSLDVSSSLPLFSPSSPSSSCLISSLPMRSSRWASRSFVRS